ncbi:hypothetical protein V8G54_035041 [Vigna mungo]|uniref:Uncharacterized protein n=1 Tax=Vigna mungo TaxID=3915 RepID=A0AAQ3MEC8_VIGMU
MPPKPCVATILSTSPQRATSAINAPTLLHELLAPGRTIYSCEIIFFTKNLHCETFTNLNRSVVQLSSSPSSPPSRLHLQPCTQKNQPKNPKSNPDQNPKNPMIDERKVGVGMSFLPLRSVPGTGKSAKLKGLPEKEE